MIIIWLNFLSHYISPWSFCDDFPTPSHDGEFAAKSPRPLQCLIFCLDDHLHRIVIDLASCAQDLLVTGDFSGNSKPPCSWIEWPPHSRNLLLVFLYALWILLKSSFMGFFNILRLLIHPPEKRLPVQQALRCQQPVALLLPRPGPGRSSGSTIPLIIMALWTCPIFNRKILEN